MNNELIVLSFYLILFFGYASISKSIGSWLTQNLDLIFADNKSKT
ncbi:MAG: hypothetical protein WC028_15340 [Candidatus Obscuribacterales bacterium]|jgi:hypothetical protein